MPTLFETLTLPSYFSILKFVLFPWRMFHVACEFYVPSLRTVFLQWFAMSARNTTVSNTPGHHLWIHLAPLTSNGHFCLFCENHFIIPLFLQSLLLLVEHPCDFQTQYSLAGTMIIHQIVLDAKAVPL